MSKKPSQQSSKKAPASKRASPLKGKPLTKAHKDAIRAGQARRRKQGGKDSAQPELSLGSLLGEAAEAFVNAWKKRRGAQ